MSSVGHAQTQVILIFRVNEIHGYFSSRYGLAAPNCGSLCPSQLAFNLSRTFLRASKNKCSPGSKFRVKSVWTYIFLNSSWFYSNLCTRSHFNMMWSNAVHLNRQCLLFAMSCRVLRRLLNSVSPLLLVLLVCKWQFLWPMVYADYVYQLAQVTYYRVYILCIL